MRLTNVAIISAFIHLTVTLLPPEVADSSDQGDGRWYRRETTWTGEDGATYKYVLPGDIKLGVILSIQQHDERRPCGTQLRYPGVVQVVEAVIYAVRLAPYHALARTRLCTWARIWDHEL